MACCNVPITRCASLGARCHGTAARELPDGLDWEISAADLFCVCLSLDGSNCPVRLGAWTRLQCQCRGGSICRIVLRIGYRQGSTRTSGVGSWLLGEAPGGNVSSLFFLGGDVRGDWLAVVLHIKKTRRLLALKYGHEASHCTCVPCKPGVRALVSVSRE